MIFGGQNAILVF